MTKKDKIEEYYNHEDDSKGVNVFKIFGIALYVIIALCYCAFIFISARAGVNKKEPEYFGHMIFNADKDVFLLNTYTEKPEIPQGAAVFAQQINAPDLKANDIIVYNPTAQSPAEDPRLANVIEVTESEEAGIFVIAISNPDEPSGQSLIAQQQLLGIAVYKVSYMGAVFDFLKSRWGIIFIIVVPSVFFLVFQILKLFRMLRAKDEPGEEEESKPDPHERTFKERVGRDPDEVLKDVHVKKAEDVLKKHFNTGSNMKSLSEDMKKFDAERTKDNFAQNTLDKTIMDLYHAGEKNSGKSDSSKETLQKEKVENNTNNNNPMPHDENKKESQTPPENNNMRKSLLNGGLDNPEGENSEVNAVDAMNAKADAIYNARNKLDENEKKELTAKLNKEVEQLTKEVPRSHNKNKNKGSISNDEYITTNGLTRLGVKAKLATDGLEIFVDKSSANMVFKFKYDGKNVVISSDEYEAQIDLS